MGLTGIAYRLSVRHVVNFCLLCYYWIGTSYRGCQCLPYTPFVTIGDKIKYRAPNLEEQEVARQYLYELIDCVNPKLIILFGNISLHMFKEDSTILKDRGTAFICMGHLFFPMYSVNYIKKLEGEMKKEAESILIKDIEMCSTLYKTIMEEK